MLVEVARGRLGWIRAIAPDVGWFGQISKFVRPLGLRRLLVPLKKKSLTVIVLLHQADQIRA